MLSSVLDIKAQFGFCGVPITSRSQRLLKELSQRPQIRASLVASCWASSPDEMCNFATPARLCDPS
jgi:hypothetical protein